MPTGTLPSASRLLVRLVLVSALVLTLAYVGRQILVRPLLPAIRASMTLLDGDFEVMSIDTARAEPNAVIRVRANLRHPMDVGVARVYPLGTHGRPNGFYQVTFLVAGVFEYCLLFVILVFAWPTATPVEHLRRAAIATPLLLLLLLIDIPFTTMAELRSLMPQDYVPDASWPLLAWSRFWAGGGGFLVAIIMAIGTIRWACPRSQRKEL
jgi:hypothetical protein